MTKIQSPFETGHCEKCKYFVEEPDSCKRHVKNIEADKPVHCKRVKICFSFQEGSERES